MRKLIGPVLVALLLLAAGDRARSQDKDKDSARAIIEKAIEAQGGEKNSDKLKNMRSKGKGSIFIEGVEILFQNETYMQLPGKCRIVSKLSVGGKEIDTVEVLNGDKSWVNEDGETKEADEAGRTEMQTAVYVSYLTILTPLLREKQFELATLGESKVEGKAAIGIKVSAKGQKDVQLFFDKESLLLVKVSRSGIEPVSRKPINQEEFYSDYKLVDGVKQPHRFEVFQEGKRLSQGEWSQYTFPASLDEKLFGKPPSKI